MTIHRSYLLPMACFLLVAACSDSNVGSLENPPQVAIELPAVGTEQLEGRSVDFLGRVQDRTTPNEELRVTWTSSLDGELYAGNADTIGVTEFSRSDLSIGLHSISLQARDSDGATGQSTVELEILEDSPPAISIVAPQPEGVYYSDLPVTLQATVSDAEDSVEDLRVSWADEAGENLASDLVPDSTGLTTGGAELDEGDWILVATATDTRGYTGTDTVTISVGPPNSAPTCSITAPADLSSSPLGELILLQGTVADVDVPADWLDVSFESNVDGPLGTLTPTSDGEAMLGVTTLTAATHTLTMQATDELGLTCTDAIIVTVSTPPSATISTPTGTDPLNSGDILTLTGTVSDAEDADDSLGVTWESDVDGLLSSPSPDSSGNVADNFGLSAGPHLLTLTATDSAGLTGTDTVSVAVNAGPTTPGVSIIPSAPTTADDLVVSIDTPSTDPDGGPAALTYDYGWTRDGAPQAAWTGLDTVPASATTSGQLWAVTVTATDSQATSDPATASVTVGNTPPSITDVTITPSAAYTDTTLTANPSGWYDADGDVPSYLYEWLADGSPVAGNAQTLSGSWFSKDETITVMVTPQDASSSGSLVSSTGVLILNTPPTAPGVTIAPSAPTDAEDLVCSVGSASTDLDADGISYSYAWLQNSSPTSYVSSTLPASATAEGETWTCEVTPNDGDDDGPTGSASVVPGPSCPSPGDGSDASCPGMSCLQILDDLFSVGDGWYWIDPMGNGAFEAYCDQTTDGGGWTRIVDHDYSVDGCPGTWVGYSQYGGLCVRDASSSADFIRSAMFDVWDIQYTELRGHISGYQYGSCDAFGDYPTTSIDNTYGDVVSFTIGAPGSRTHLFSYVCGYGTSSGDDSNCPTEPGGAPPHAWVGGNYECASGNQTGGSPSGSWHPLQLFVGHWFQSVVGVSTTEDVEGRLIATHSSSNEDLGVAELTLFVR